MNARSPPVGTRQAAMAGFLAAAGWDGVVPVSLAGDASFRRYYRLVDGARRVVLMDAPPPLEDVRPYMAVAAILRGLGLSAPQIIAEDGEHGFLLIEDFGDDSYTRLLAGGADEAALYALAIDTLVALHQAVAASGLPPLPPYDAARLLGEAALLRRLVCAERARRRRFRRRRARIISRGGAISCRRRRFPARRWCCATITSTI